MSRYKIGDRLIYLQGGYIVEIIEIKPFGFGGAQYRVKRVDDNLIGRKWVNHKDLNRLCSSSKMAQVLYSNKVTKAVANETDEI